MPAGVMKETVVRRAHPGGAKGARLGLQEVAARAWAARGDPRVRAWSLQALAGAGNPTGRRARVQAIVDAFRRQVPYVSDPVNVEFMAGPVQTLCLDDHGLCMLGGDCDDAAITCMACCLSVGIAPVWAVGASYKAPIETPTHVYFGFEDDFGRQVVADPTTSLPVGTAHPAARTWWVNPTDALDASSLQGGEFVGVGRPPDGPGLAPLEPRAVSDWGDVNLAGAPVFGLGDYVVANAVAVLAQEVDGAMHATDAGVTACTSLAASDVADWKGTYGAWQSWLSGFNACQSAWLPGWKTACQPYYDTFNGWAAADAALLQYRSLVKTWQDRVKAACSTFNPSPDIPIPPPTPPGTTTLGEDLAAAGKTIVTVVVVGVLGYAGYKAIQIASRAA